jgi:hypothetical protein
VEEMQFPQGTEVTAHTGYGTEDGWEIDYGVSEEVPKPKAPVPPEDDGPLAGFLPRPYEAYRSDGDFREATLRVDGGSVEVHHIEWVKVNSTHFAVSRHRREKQDWKF